MPTKYYLRLRPKKRIMSPTLVLPSLFTAAALLSSPAAQHGLCVRAAFSRELPRVACLRMEDGKETQDLDPARLSSETQDKLAAMQARNTQTGATVLAALLLAIVWIFTLPPEIRRSRAPPPEIVQKISEHYGTCGQGAADPCVQFDLSIDPRSRAWFEATLSQLTQ